MKGRTEMGLEMFSRYSYCEDIVEGSKKRFTCFSHAGMVF